MVRNFSLPFSSRYGIRLHRIGCNNRPFYLIGTMPKSRPVGNSPDLRPDEVIGSVDPMPNEHGELIVACDLNKLCYYLGKGAHPSKLLAHYLGMIGFYPFHPKVLVNAMRIREGKPTRRGIKVNVRDAEKEDKQEAVESN